MGAPSKRARKIRAASEFDLVRLSAELRAPRDHSAGGYWTLEQIFAARDAQMAGHFLQPVRLAEMMRTDDVLFTPRERRLDPSRCTQVKLVPANTTARAISICGEADASFGPKGVGVHPDTISDIHGCLVDHGIAIGVNVTTPRADGSRVDFEHKEWPLEFVRWDPLDRVLRTLVDPQGQAPFAEPGYQGGALGEPIVHGNGRWTIYKKHELYPWRQEACVIPGAILFGRHAFAMRAWDKGSTAHGNAKVVGEMPEGVSLQDENGNLTPQAREYLELLRAIASFDTPIGIQPAGAKTQYLVNSSNAWQVWKELADNAKGAGERIYLGADGASGQTMGAPGVNAEALFGVAATKVEGDLRCIERGILTGVIEPWCAMNFGDSTLAPQRCYQIPDGDEAALAKAADERQKALAERTKTFFDTLAVVRSSGFVADKTYVDGLAADYGVRAPTLPDEAAKAPTITLAPTDVAKVVYVNEARASAGLGPMILPDGTPDPDGKLTVAAFDAKQQAAAKAPTVAPAAAAPALPRRIG